jgi:prolyl-tRNA editing enzyme YbaK/EbsC (Cys-tRNA(Pro) deacylase)
MMIGAMDVHRELLAREIPHEIVRLPRVVLNASELPEALRLPASQCVATRLYYVDDIPTAIAVPALTTPEPRAILAALDATTLRPATVEQTNELTRYAAGLVSAAMLPAGLPLFVDARLDLSGVVYLPTGDTGTALGMHGSTFLRLSGARLAHLVDVPVIQLPRDVSRVPL